MVQLKCSRCHRESWTTPTSSEVNIICTHNLREAGLGLLPATIRVSLRAGGAAQSVCVRWAVFPMYTKAPSPPSFLLEWLLFLWYSPSWIKVPMGGPQKSLSYGWGWKTAHRRREVLQREVWIQTVTAMFMVSGTVRSFWEAQLVTWKRLGISEQWF